MTFLLGGLTFHFMAHIFPNFGHLGSKYIFIPWKPKTPKDQRLLKPNCPLELLNTKPLRPLLLSTRGFFRMVNSAGALVGMVKNMTLSKDVGDLQLGDKKVTLNQLVYIYMI